MNCKIQEEVGALRDFYPDAGMRAEILRGFAFLFLPQYVAQNPRAFFSYLFRKDQPGGAMDPTRFIQSRWTLFEEKAGLAPSSLESFKTGVVRSRRLTDLSMSLHEVDGHPAAVIQLPEPETAGLAHFVAVVLLAPAARPEEWPGNVRARIFALERNILQSSGENTAVLCEMPNSTRHSPGPPIPINRDAFLKAVKLRVRVPEPPVETPHPGNGVSMRGDSEIGLSEQQARAQLDAFFEGGDGSSAAKAVRINMRRVADPGSRQLMGVQLEYYWIERRLPGARTQGQRLHHEENGVFDVVTVALPSGEQRDVWFDISSFFGGGPGEQTHDGSEGGLPDRAIATVVGVVIGLLFLWVLFKLGDTAHKPAPPPARIDSYQWSGKSLPLPPPAIPKSGNAAAARQTSITVTDPDPTVRLEAGLGNHLRADSERAVGAFKAGRIIEAELQTERIIRDFDALMREPDTTYRCFRNASDQRQFTEANPNIGKLVWIDWRYTELLQFRAFIYVQRRQLEPALEVLDKSIRFAPDNATAHNERGYILAQTSRFAEALKAYEAAREASNRTGGSRSEEAAALRGIGGTWVDLGDLDKAEKALRESLVLEPNSAVAQRELVFIRQLRAKRAERAPQP